MNSGNSSKSASVCLLLTCFLMATAVRPQTSPASDPAYTDAAAEAEVLHAQVRNIDREIARLGGGRSTIESLKNVRSRQGTLRQYLIRMEEVIGSTERSTTELEAIRNEVASKPLVTLDDVLSEVKENAVETTVGTLLEKTVKRLPVVALRNIFGIADKAATVITIGGRWWNRRVAVAELQNMIRNNEINVGDLYDVVRAARLQLALEIERERSINELAKERQATYSKAVEAQKRLNLLSRRATDSAITTRNTGDIELLRIMGVWSFTISPRSGPQTSGFLIVRPDGNYRGVFTGGTWNHVESISLSGYEFVAKPTNQTVRMKLSPDGNQLAGTWADGFASDQSPQPATMRRVRTAAQEVGSRWLNETTIAVDFIGQFLPTDPRIMQSGTVEAEGGFTVSRFGEIPGSNTMRVELNVGGSEKPGRKYLILNGTRVPWMFSRENSPAR